MKILILRFDAPLISFGAPIVDNHGVIQPYPALSMICGMLANALGYHHRDSHKLQRLQERIRYASRCDKRGRRIQDFQTVSLGADYMSDANAWTSTGTLEERKGGSASSGTHIRYRDYWSDAVHTIALTLTPFDEDPDLAQIAAALNRPERPLFIGRKTCLPAAPIYRATVDAPDLLTALKEFAVDARADEGSLYPAWWPSQPGRATPGERLRHMPVTDEKDWKNQIHVGERWIAHGTIEVLPTEQS